jgi:hypothetical protein
MEPNRQPDEDDRLWQQLVLPEEDRCRLHGRVASGPCRWFRSENVIDLWRYRGPAERTRIGDVLLRDQP